MKVAIPKTIEVAGVTYQVEWGEEAQRHLKDEICNGRSNKQELWIRIDPTQARFGQTFIHELTHAIAYEYAHDVLEEEDVDAMAAGFMQILRQLGIELVLEV